MRRNSGTRNTAVARKMVASWRRGMAAPRRMETASLGDARCCRRARLCDRGASTRFSGILARMHAQAGHAIERLGRYQIRELVGEGAMATVYKAYDPEINRTIAIKLLKSQLREDDEYHSRFVREAKGAGILSHPNIVTVYDVGEDDKHPYIAM